MLSKISLSTGTRHKSNLVETEYEVPRAAIAEAVINALVHRDYYSKGSVQISVFSNRIEIENPGHLPDEITIADLKRAHASYPNNPLLANCLFYAGAIDRYGTGTLDIIQDVTGKGLPEPEFFSQRTFKVFLWRKHHTGEQAGEQVREQVREQAGEQVEEQVKEQYGDHAEDKTEEKIQLLASCIQGKLSASELMNLLSLKGRRNFLQNYLHPAIKAGFVEMTQPDSPKSPTQKYRLTAKGMALREKLEEK